MKIHDIDYEVVVAGGGMVGAAFALELAQVGFRVLIIEPTPPELVTDSVLPDLRISAISCVSVAMMRHISAWQRLNKWYCVPYRRLEIWEWPSSMVVFDADSFNLPELGFMVENRRLRYALWQCFTDHDVLTLRCPASLIAMKLNDGYWQLTLNDGNHVTSRLVVGADGANSWIRQQIGIGVSGWQYRQSCLLVSVEMNSKQQQDVTWQIFHPSGPRAFLPLYDRWASLVWYDGAARIRQLQKLSLSALAQEVQVAFPGRLGDFTIHGVASFPLARCHAYYYVLPGLALIGDAAHTVNPLAGLGVNLGFRDANTLAQVLITARNRGERWESLAILQRYQRCRRSYNLLIQAGIDAFYMVFSNHLPPLMLARNIGLMLAQRAGGLKLMALRYVLGL